MPVVSFQLQKTKQNKPMWWTLFFLFFRKWGSERFRNLFKIAQPEISRASWGTQCFPCQTRAFYSWPAHYVALSKWSSLDFRLPLCEMVRDREGTWQGVGAGRSREQSVGAVE